MDREQILEDLKEWAGDAIEFDYQITGYALLSKIEELEEEYE